MCPVNRKQLKSLEYVLTSSLMKMVRTKSKDAVNECMMFFGLTNMECNNGMRKRRFMQNYVMFVKAVRYAALCLPLTDIFANIVLADLYAICCKRLMFIVYL